MFPGDWLEIKATALDGWREDEVGVEVAGRPAEPCGWCEESVSKESSAPRNEVERRRLSRWKLGGSRARFRRAKVRPYTRSVTPSKIAARILYVVWM